MADRTCELCEKVFQRPNHLRKHQGRKTPCAPILEKGDLPETVLEDPYLVQKKCRFCGRVLSSYTSMRRHVREACRIAPNKKNGDEGMERLYEHTLRKQQTEIAELKVCMEAQNARMEAQTAEMMAMMQQLVSRGGGSAQAGEVAIAGNQNVVDNKKVFTSVNINVFGQEGLDHVTADRIKAILDESLRVPALPAAAGTAVLKTALLVYSDPDRPENLTCYLPNKKTNDALVHLSRPDGTTGWEVQPTTLVLPPMAQKSVDSLFDLQPFEDADQYAPLMKELQANEKRYTAGGDLRPVLVRNKDLLQRALAELPVRGTSTGDG